MSKKGSKKQHQPDMQVVGRPRRRVDGRAKVTGQTRFADDIILPRMLHCKLLRSPLPHARIVSIDTSRALAHQFNSLRAGAYSKRSRRTWWCEHQLRIRDAIS